MTPEKRKFIKAMKARQRRRAFLKNGRKVHPVQFDANRYIKSLQKPNERRKETFFQRMKKKIF